MIGCCIQAWAWSSLVASLWRDELMRLPWSHVDKLLRSTENKAIEWTRIVLVLAQGECTAVNIRHPRHRSRHGHKSTKGKE